MERLPQEIIDKIASLIYHDPKRLKAGSQTISPSPAHPPAPSASARSRVEWLACVSRQWKLAIERLTFRSLALKSSELAEFERYVREERHNYVKTLNLTIILPSYAEASSMFERVFERKANDEAFSLVFHHLFRVLASWGQSEEPHVILELSDVYSLSDPRPAAGTIDRYRYSYLRLERPGDLPSVACISGFDSKMNHDRMSRRHVPQQVWVELLAKMPNVRNAILDASAACGELRRYPVIRRNQRDDFTSALTNHSLPSAIDGDLCLHLGQLPHLNQTWQPMSLVPDRLQSDPTGSAIWTATSKLNRVKRLIILGSLDPSLLWPGSFGLLTPEPKPFWQGVTLLVITFDLVSPSGNWYFRAPDGIDIERPPFLPADETHLIDAEPEGAGDAELPPGYGSVESSSIEDFDTRLDLLRSGNAPRWIFRLVPEERLLCPLIEAWSRAVSQMPNISKAILRTKLPLPVTDRRQDPEFEWKIRYLAPCECNSCSIGYTRPEEWNHYCSGRDIRMLRLRTLGWRPDAALMGLLRSIGTRYHDCEIKEEYPAANDILERLGL